MIPTVIALSSFFASSFPDVSWYPYWYLGNPYHYLIGPVVPAILTIFNFPFGFAQGGQFSIFNLTRVYLVLILSSFVWGSFGIYFFLKDWGVGKRQALLSSFLYLIFPAGFYLLNYQNGLNHIAFAVLPFMLLSYRRFLQSERSSVAILLSFLMAIALLIDISILLPLVVGMVALFISLETKKAEDDKIIKTILILLSAIFLSSIWYTLRFWWIVLASPSFGGVPLFNLIVSLFKLLLNLTPIVLAVIFVKWRKFRPKGYLLFSTLFLVSFMFLTIVGFLSDPDFVMDWTGFFLELQFSGAIILGWFFERHIKFSIFLVLPIFITALIIVSLFNCSIVKLVAMKQCSNEAMQNSYQNRVTLMIKNNVGSNDRIFLSGSSVFWINSKINILQVRGGGDQGSIHPFWADAAYQIREGQNALLSKNWLIALGASYVLVHEKGSSEPFWDFKNPSKFSDNNFRLVEENMGDRLYRVAKASIARVADIKMLAVKRPLGGGDNEALARYASLIKRPIHFRFKEKNGMEIKVNLKNNEVISLALAYDPNLVLSKGQGSVISDSLGNTIIIPKRFGEQVFVLKFKSNFLDISIPAVMFLVAILLIIKYDKISPYLKKSLPQFSLGINGKDY